MANSDDIRIVVEGNDLTISSVDSENITVSVSDYVAFWAEISGKPSDSTALTNYIKSIADGKISTHDLSETAHAFIQQRITNETTARQTADTTLQTNINTEITNRQTAVANEATARTNADNTLQANINIEAGTRANADSAITSNLNTEITNRETADTQLQADITAEASTRAGADANLQASINTKQDKLTAGSNVQINNNVISATDTTYTAGTGISIVDNVISNTQTSAEWGMIEGNINDQQDLIDLLSNKQDNLIAGSNIQINENTISATDTKYTAGTGISISAQNVISNTQTSAEWGNITGTLANQTDLQTALNGKQATISDLSAIRSNATAGKSASETISGYGNIVTHNTSEFATSAQGQLANTALQPNDNITKLNNNAGYITNSALAGYATETYVNNHHDSTKQNTLTAGANIQINNNTISATDTTYTAGSGITISNNTISADQEIFVATYGTTTYTEIETALTNNLVPVCKYESKMYYYVYTVGNVHYFVCDYFPFIYILRCYQGAPYWAPASVVSEQTGNKVTTISASSTDTQYPSAKAVYGYHDSTKQDTLVSGTNIKTINSTSLLGSGNVAVQPTLVSGTNIKTINNQSILGSGNITIQGTGPNVVQTTGNSTTDVMSQKAVTEYPAVQNVYSSTMLFKKHAGSIDGYAQSLKTYTLDELKDVNVVQRAIRPSGTTLNHYDATGTPAIYLYKDDNNFIFFGVNSYSVKSRIKINGVMLEDITLFTFGAATGDINTSASIYYRLDLHNKKMIMKNINETTGVEQILTEHDFSSLDISAFSDFYIRSGHSVYQTPVAVQHLAVNSILDYNEMLSQKLEYGKYNAFSTTDYNSNLTVASNGVAIAGTLSLDEPNHKISTVSQATMGYFKMGVNGTSATESTMKTVQCFRLKVTDGTMKIQQGAKVNYGYVCEGDKVVYKLSNTPFTLTNNVEYTIYSKTIDTVNYARNYSFYAQGDFTVDISDGFLTFPASVNLCAETYNGTYFRGGLPCSGVNEEFLNYNNLFSIWNTYPSIPLYTQMVDSSGNILMFNGTAWKQVSN